MALVAMSGIESNNTMGESRNWWEVLVEGAPDIIKSIPNGGGGGGGSQYDNYPPYQPQTQSTGISTNTVLLIAGAGLAAYFLLKKK